VASPVHAASAAANKVRSAMIVPQQFPRQAELLFYKSGFAEAHPP
jgi:hypothetical protein